MRDLHARRREHARRAARRDDRVVTGERRELVGRGAEREPRELGDLRRDARRPLGMRVEPGADGGAAEREVEQALLRLVELLLGERELRGPAAHLLTERERRRVHQVRAPDLHDVRERLALLRDRRAEARDRRHEPMRDARGRRDVHHRREHVVRRLRHVHVVVGMDRALRLAAERRAADLVGDGSR